jgi:asparagine synthase (glutamine-hydrolysing)
MCGINGIITLHRDAGAVVNLMNRHLHHRGPDGDGVYLAGSLGMGHVRLSILDLTNAGAQPMQFKHWVLVFNGEIYNFHALRDILISYDYQFVSRSDTEVLLKAWD